MDPASQTDAPLRAEMSTSINKDEAAPRHICHCGKAFIRKEHLRRHQATHGERNFVCQVCQRSFTRNDLLRRHLSRHDTPSGPDIRRNRACDACHANKTKCDGGAQCSLCAKRDIDCTYKHAQGNKTNLTSTIGYRKGDGVLKEPQPPTDPQLIPDEDENSYPSGSEADVEMKESEVNGLGLDLQQNDAADDVFSSLLTQLITRFEPPSIRLEQRFELSDEEKTWFLQNTEHYFSRFHESWPIIHGPTFWVEKLCLPSLTAVFIIAAWLKDPNKYLQLVARLHESLTSRFITTLSRPIICDGDTGPWPIAIYKSILLNIILALYLGSENFIANAVILRGMLVSTLRELDFFNSDSASHQQNTHLPGTFLPYVQTNREQWKRIATSLYKIDGYLAIVRDQPPLLHREELDVSLTSTYALWNSFGLDIFFKRLPHEPSDRAGYKFSGVLSNPRSPARPLMLIEDVTLGLCSLILRVWNHAQVRRRGTGPANINSDSQASLSWQLECWKEELKRISSSCFQSYIEKRFDEFPFIAYLGREGENPEHCKMLAISHIKGLVSDSMSLYNILGLQIYSDIKIIRAITIYASNHASNDSSDSSPPLRIQKYRSQLQDWTRTPESRRALLHAIAVLQTQEQAMSGQNHKAQFELFSPVTYMATSLSAIVLWAWVTFAEEACSCIPGRNHINIGVDPPDLQSTTQLENWIQSGGTAALHGIAVCRCLVEGWMARFAACVIHEGGNWALIHSIAPVLSLGG